MRVTKNPAFHKNNFTFGGSGCPEKDSDLCGKSYISYFLTPSASRASPKLASPAFFQSRPCSKCQAGCGTQPALHTSLLFLCTCLRIAGACPFSLGSAVVLYLSSALTPPWSRRSCHWLHLVSMAPLEECKLESCWGKLFSSRTSSLLIPASPVSDE